MLAKMASIGVEPCKTVSFSADVTKAIADLPKDALAEITKNQSELGKEANGWTITEGLGNYGTDYMKRAVVAAFGWPANRQEDAVYPYTFVDSTGAQLSGANSYALTFAKEQLPPARGFWSITMYEIDNGWWFVPNSLNKFTVSMRDKPVANADGSYTFTFQADSPGADKEANWLPAPKGDFLLMMRMYWPSDTAPSILDGSWTPPAVEKVSK